MKNQALKIEKENEFFFPAMILIRIIKYKLKIFI